jgi:hypothetical protein
MHLFDIYTLHEHIQFSINRQYMNMSKSLHKYWRKCQAKIERNQKRSFDATMIYFWRNIWKGAE